jgi:hypothetical protein
MQTKMLEESSDSMNCRLQKGVFKSTCRKNETFKGKNETFKGPEQIRRGFVGKRTLTLSERQIEKYELLHLTISVGHAP